MNNGYARARVVICYGLLWSMAIWYYFVISSFSMAPARESDKSSTGVIEILKSTTETVIREEIPEVKGMKKVRINAALRKVAHILNFFILAFLHSMLFFKGSNGKLVHTTILVLLMGLCGAVMDEALQFFVEGRSASFRDVLIDFVGTCTGLLVFVGLIRMSVKKRLSLCL